MRDWISNCIHQYQRAVFLDRDGTISVDKDYPHRIEDLRLITGSTDGLVCLAKLPLHIIVVSNQAGIAKRLFTRTQMSRFNAHLRSEIENAGARIDAFYFCPHLEPKDLPLGVAPCTCSKPSPGLLLEAARDFELDLNESFLIGDKISDIAAGADVNCTTILVRTGKAGKGEKGLLAEPKYSADNLFEAALIVQSYFSSVRKHPGD